VRRLSSGDSETKRTWECTESFIRE
jgi:hypothetical protein